MNSAREKVAFAVLCGMTGVSVTTVSVLAYFRIQSPKEFVDTSMKASRLDLKDEASRKWGIYGTGLSELIPQKWIDFFVPPNAAEQVYAQRNARVAQIRRALEEMRPR
ncbi:hypothetical protein ABG067_000358 [Albugo candida]